MNFAVGLYQIGGWESTTSSTVHTFYLSSKSIKNFQPYTACTLWCAHDSTICIRPSITVWPNMNRLFGPLFGTDANTKRIFSIAVLCGYCVLPYWSKNSVCLPALLPVSVCLSVHHTSHSATVSKQLHHFITCQVRHSSSLSQFSFTEFWQ